MLFCRLRWAFHQRNLRDDVADQSDDDEHDDDEHDDDENALKANDVQIDDEVDEDVAALLAEDNDDNIGFVEKTNFCFS